MNHVERTLLQHPGILLVAVLVTCAAPGTLLSAEERPLTLLWQFATGGLIRSSPAVAGSVVYVGSDDGNLYALATQTGELLWKYETAGPVWSSPVVGGPRIYVGSDDGTLYALDAVAGYPIWRHPTRGSILTSPAIGDGLVYVSSHDQQLYALDAAFGNVVWRYSTQFSETTSPAFALNGLTDPQSCVTLVSVTQCAQVDGVLIGVANSVRALDAATGNLLWDYRTPDYAWSSLTATGRAHYIGADDGSLHALDSEGTRLWRYKIGDSLLASPTLANGVVYIGSLDGRLYAVDAIRGDLLWSYPTPRAIYSSVAVSGEVAYVVSSDDHLYALNASTGELLDRQKVGRGDAGSHFPGSSPTVADRTLYVGGDDGNLYAFRLPVPFCRGFFRNVCQETPWGRILENAVFMSVLSILVTVATAAFQLYRGK